jgi:hypothetical protein
MTLRIPAITLLAASRAGGEENAQEAAVAKIETKEDGNSLVEATKGTRPPAVLGVPLRGPADPVLHIRPKAAVETGEEWKISAAGVSRFCRLAASGLAGASRPGGFVKLLAEVRSAKDSPEAQEVTAKVASLSGSEATIEFAAQRDGGIATTELTGALSWSAARGEADPARLVDQARDAGGRRAAHVAVVGNFQGHPHVEVEGQ